MLEMPTLGTLNAHPGLLPRYRGVDVVAWAVLNGDPVGVSVHLVDAGIDTGRICRTRELPIHRGDTLEEVKRACGDRVRTTSWPMWWPTPVASRGIEAHATEERYPVHRRMDEARLREVRRRLSAS